MVTVCLTVRLNNHGNKNISLNYLGGLNPRPFLDFINARYLGMNCPSINLVDRFLSFDNPWNFKVHFFCEGKFVIGLPCTC